MKITYKNKVVEIEKPMKVIDILKDECSESTIACKCNNQIRALDYIIEEDTKVDFIDASDKDGIRIYIRSIMYIMSKAFSEIYPSALISINYQLSHSMYCEIDNMEVTEEMLQKVSDRMKKIIERNIEIKKVTMSKEEAEEFYKENKTLRGILQLDCKKKEYVTLYYCEDYYNYFYGVMPISTGYTKVFSLEKYNNGFLLRYPSKKDITRLPEFKNNKQLLKTLQDYEKIHEQLDENTVYKLNKKIQDGSSKEVVLLDEALHEKKISNIADQIAENDKVKMVLIAGPSSSGKTTFAQRLGLQLKINGLKPITISVDNYFVEREQTPRDENGEYDFESIYAVDIKLFNDHISRLLKGEEVEMPTFNFHTGHKEYKGETLKLGPNDIMVIEGIHCLNDELTPLIPNENKFKVYISALTVLNIDYFNRISTTDSRLIRRIVRDYQFRGYTALHTLRMWESVNRGEEKNIFPYQEKADAMFNTSLVYELSALKPFVIPLLEEINKSEPEYAEARRLCDLLQYLEPIDKNLIPSNSLLREFIGGGDFKY